MVGHPYAHSGVFLSEQLAACDDVAVFAANPFAEGELNRAKQQRNHAKPQDDIPVSLAVQKDEVDGLPDGEQKGH